MKSVSNVSLIVLIVGTCVLGSTYEASATNVITYRPGPGANDGSDQGALDGGKDTWAFQVEPNANKGDTPAHPTWKSTCNPWTTQSFFQFDISTLPDYEDVIRVEWVTQQKITRGYGWDYPIPNPTLDLFPILAPWSETDLTWNTRPLVDPTAAASSMLMFSNVSGGDDYTFFEGEVAFDITDLYTLWKAGLPNNGVMIERREDWCEDAIGHLIYSSDNEDISLRPALRITTAGGGVPAPVPEPMTITAMMAGIGGIGAYIRRRRIA